MSDDPSHGEGMARMARELAHSGKCKDIVELEAALTKQGYSVEFLQEPILRAELELLFEDAHKPQG